MDEKFKVCQMDIWGVSYIGFQKTGNPLKGDNMAEKGLADGKCIKCDSTVISREDCVIGGPSGSIWSLKNVEVVTFVCQKCGFMEFYYKGKSFWK